MDIRIQIFSDTDNFLSDINMNTVFNLEPNMNNYLDMDIFKI
jgi:hypothetical protein